MNKFILKKINGLDDAVLQSIRLYDVDFYEYRNINIEQKKEYTINRIKNICSKENNIAFAVYRQGKPMAIWAIYKDDFDSDIFEINIYKIAYFIILEDNTSFWDGIISASLDHLAYQLHHNNKSSYFLIGLNTNLLRNPIIFNILVRKGFHYIHTLLTYQMQKNEFANLRLPHSSGFNIREAREEDVEKVMDLAKRSFKYSRLLLDPFLDKEKGKNLLAISAKNSILNGFVDIMYVAEVEKKIVGYYSGKKKMIKEFNLGFGEGVISAVDEEYRGLGIFKDLNTNLLGWFYRNTDFAELGTYIANTPVHKTWNNNGLSIVRGTHQLAFYISAEDKRYSDSKKESY